MPVAFLYKHKFDGVYKFSIFFRRCPLSVFQWILELSDLFSLKMSWIFAWKKKSRHLFLASFTEAFLADCKQLFWDPLCPCRVQIQAFASRKFSSCMSESRLIFSVPFRLLFWISIIYKVRLLCYLRLLIPFIIWVIFCSKILVYFSRFKFDFRFFFFFLFFSPFLS